MKRVLDFLLFVYILSIYLLSYLDNLNVVSNSIAIIFVGLVSIKIMTEKRKIRWNLYLTLFLLFIVICGCTYFEAMVKDAVITKVFTLLQLFVLSFAIVQYVETKEDMLRILKYIAFAGLITSIYFFSHLDINSSKRLGGGLANLLGAIISYSCLTSLYLRNLTKNIMYFFMALVMMAAVVMTGSRSSLLYFIFGFLLFIFLQSKGSIKHKINSLFLLLFVICIGLYLFTNVPYFYKVIGARVTNLFNFISGEGGVLESSIVTRNYMIWYGLEMFKYKPVLGYGIGNSFVLLHSSAYFAYGYFHSNIIEILVSVGIIGFTAYYAIFVSTIIKLWQKSDNQLAVLFLVLIIPMFVLHVQSVVYYDKMDYIVLGVASTLFLPLGRENKENG